MALTDRYKSLLGMAWDDGFFTSGPNPNGQMVRRFPTEKDRKKVRDMSEDELVSQLDFYAIIALRKANEATAILDTQKLSLQDKIVILSDSE